MLGHGTHKYPDPQTLWLAPQSFFEHGPVYPWGRGSGRARAKLARKVATKIETRMINELEVKTQRRIGNIVENWIDEDHGEENQKREI